MVRLKNWMLVGTLGLGLFSTGISAQGETLQDAINQTYATNPTLGVSRAQERFAREQISSQNAGWLPKITIQGSYGYSYSHLLYRDKTTQRTLGGTSYNQPITGTVTLTQNIFNGGQTLHSARQARYNWRAEKQSYLDSEQTLFVNLVESYMNVLRDEDIVTLYKNNLTLLEEELSLDEVRYKTGTITLADLSQTRASVSLARAEIANSKAQLEASRSMYEDVVGHAPQNLQRPNSFENRLPDSEYAVLEKARLNNPVLRAVVFQERASHEGISSARGRVFSPSIDIQASYQYIHHPNSQMSQQHAGIVQGVLTIPLYEGGSSYAALKQAEAVNAQNRYNIEVVRRNLTRQIHTVWQNWVRDKKMMTAGRRQVVADQVALDNMTKEYKQGTRTVFDVLTAHQTLLNAQVSLVSSRTSRFIDAVLLLSLSGEFGAKDLQAQYAAGGAQEVSASLDSDDISLSETPSLSAIAPPAAPSATTSSTSPASATEAVKTASTTSEDIAQ